MWFQTVSCLSPSNWNKHKAPTCKWNKPHCHNCVHLLNQIVLFVDDIISVVRSKTVQTETTVAILWCWGLQFPLCVVKDLRCESESFVCSTDIIGIKGPQKKLSIVKHNAIFFKTELWQSIAMDSHEWEMMHWSLQNQLWLMVWQSRGWQLQIMQKGSRNVFAHCSCHCWMMERSAGAMLQQISLLMKCECCLLLCCWCHGSFWSLLCCWLGCSSRCLSVEFCGDAHMFCVVLQQSWWLQLHLRVRGSVHHAWMFLQLNLGIVFKMQNLTFWQQCAQHRAWTKHHDDDKSKQAQRNW